MGLAEKCSVIPQIIPSFLSLQQHLIQFSNKRKQIHGATEKFHFHLLHLPIIRSPMARSPYDMRLFWWRVCVVGPPLLGLAHIPANKRTHRKYSISNLHSRAADSTGIHTRTQRAWGANKHTHARTLARRKCHHRPLGIDLFNPKR